jgi:uncharacterized protein
MRSNEKAYDTPAMRIQLEANAALNRIRAYTPGRVIVNETAYERSLVLTPERVLPDWPPQRLEDLTAEHFAQAVQLKPEVLLLGVGRAMRFPPQSVLALLYQAGIGVEVMDTHAACRTYNILMGDGRRVAAALIMTPSDDG